MAYATQLAPTLRVSCVLLLLMVLAAAQTGPDAPTEESGKVRAKVTRAADRPGQPVVSADLSLSDATDEDLTALEGLPELRVLDVSFTRVTDQGLSHLVGLRKL